MGVRKILKIDENKCNGCGLCIPACAEGALKVVNGKARLISEKYCDGLGACIGNCPKGAISIEERDAKDFDEGAVKNHLHIEKAASTSRLGKSALPQWPVQPPKISGTFDHSEACRASLSPFYSQHLNSL